jgi:hypothetical protein
VASYGALKWPYKAWEVTEVNPTNGEAVVAEFGTLRGHPEAAMHKVRQAYPAAQISLMYTPRKRT